MPQSNLEGREQRAAEQLSCTLYKGICTKAYVQRKGSCAVETWMIRKHLCKGSMHIGTGLRLMQLY